MKNIITLIFLLNTIVSFGQITIGNITEIKNGSFEVKSKRQYFEIKDWLDCGTSFYSNESPPDIHPNKKWEVSMAPDSGQYYLGLVVRDNDSYEIISQQLPNTLLKDRCYEFTISLAQSPKYISRSRKLNRRINFKSPAILRIYGGNSVYCNTCELLAASPPIDHSYWQKYKFKFRPATDLKSISLLAYFVDDKKMPYNGHILIDSISDIIEIECKD